MKKNIYILYYGFYLKSTKICHFKNIQIIKQVMFLLQNTSYNLYIFFIHQINLKFIHIFS